MKVLKNPIFQLPFSFVSRHLILFTTLFFIAGITTGNLLPAGLTYLFYLLFIAAALAALLFYFTNRPTVALLFALILLALAGMHRITSVQAPRSPEHIYNRITARQEATVVGIVDRTPSFNGEKTRLLLDVHTIILPDGGRHATAGLVQLSLKGELENMPVPGRQVAARARLSRIRNYKTPGAFDYRTFMARKSIWITGWITSPELIRTLSAPENLTTRVIHAPERVRRKIIGFLQSSDLAPAVKGIYQAILTGERGGIPEEADQAFKAAGSYHLLAISGMHLGLLALFTGSFILFILRQFPALLLRFRVFKIAAVSTLPFLLAYALIAGFQPPAIRAFIMCAIAVLALVSDRKHFLDIALGTAALLILIFEPAALFTASFQLSFGAVIMIGLCHRHIDNLGRTIRNMPLMQSTPVLGKIPAWAAMALAVSVVAVLGTLPAQLVHFHRFSPMSPFSTLLIAPLICFWSLPIGMAASIVAFVFPGLAGFLFAVGGLAIRLSIHIAGFFATIPGSSIWLPPPGFMEILLYFLFVCSLMFFSRHRMFNYLAPACLILLLAIPLTRHANRRLNKTATVSFLDVGQGTSTLVELPGGYTFLIDGGGAGTSRFNVGEQLIAPFLWHKRITSIDEIIVTHQHADHYNGLDFIVDKFNPHTVWMNNRQPASADFRNFLNKLEQRGISIKIPAKGAALYSGDNTRLSCIGNFHETGKTGHPGKQNQNSLVLHLQAGEHSFLFPGDITENEQRILAGDPTLNRTNIVLAPHHGSGTEPDSAFLANLSPRYMVFSAAGYFLERLRYPEMTEVLETKNMRPLSTFNDGTISFECRQGQPIVVKVYSKLE